MKYANLVREKLIKRINKYMSNLLTEAYEQVRINKLIESLRNEGKTQEQIDTYLKEAGLWDRLKAKGASAAQTIKGAGQTVKGLAKQGVANVAQKGVDMATKGLNSVGVKTDATQANQAIQGMKQSGQQQVQGVQDAAQAAKVNSIFQAHSKDLTNVMSAIVNDLKKLGIETKGISANTLIGQLRNSLGLPKETTQPTPAPATAPQSTAGYVQTNTSPVLPTAAAA